MFYLRIDCIFCFIQSVLIFHKLSKRVCYKIYLYVLQTILSHIYVYALSLYLSFYPYTVIYSRCPIDCSRLCVQVCMCKLARFACVFLLCLHMVVTHMSCIPWSSALSPGPSWLENSSPQHCLHYNRIDPYMLYSQLGTHIGNIHRGHSCLSKLSICMSLSGSDLYLYLI